MSEIEFVNNSLRLITSKLNSLNLNYYVVGAVGAYIDAGLPIQRNHEDIDIMIEEKDIDKLKEVFKDTDFYFVDNRYNSSKTLNKHGYTDGEHEVYASYKYGNFHFGFFLFRQDDSSYTIIEYFTENNSCKKLERSLPLDIFQYQYNNKKRKYLGVEMKVVRKELIYKNKKVMNRGKDLFDIEKLESKIDVEILNKLKGLSKIRKSEIVQVKK